MMAKLININSESIYLCIINNASVNPAALIVSLEGMLFNMSSLTLSG